MEERVLSHVHSSRRFLSVLTVTKGSYLVRFWLAIVYICNVLGNCQQCHIKRLVFSAFTTNIMSPSRSPEALYHAIPQALAPEDDHQSPPDILELEADGTTEADGYFAPSHPPAAIVDTQVWWIHFILGCCVLLPWNGALQSIALLLHVLIHAFDAIYCSYDYSNAIFSFSTKRFPSEGSI